MEKLKQLIDFGNKLKQIAFLSVETKGDKTIDKLFQKAAKNKNLLLDFVADFKNDYGVQLDEKLAYVLFLTCYRTSWSRGETYSKEGYLEGGFSFNGMEDLVSTNPKFWKNAVDNFITYEGTEKIDFALLEQLRWFESLHHFLNSSSSNIPYGTCVQLNNGKCPNTFYFFDGGIIHSLQISSFENYIDSLIASVGVACWQYFYIDPVEIIEKNKGTHYMTWILKTSDLAEGINHLKPHNNIPFDRLDLIAEYLERCVRILPETFSFLDFSYHQKHYAEFKKLYDASKNQHP